MARCRVVATAWCWWQRPVPLSYVSACGSPHRVWDSCNAFGERVSSCIYIDAVMACCVVVPPWQVLEIMASSSPKVHRIPMISATGQLKRIVSQSSIVHFLHNVRLRVCVVRGTAGRGVR